MVGCGAGGGDSGAEKCAERFPESMMCRLSCKPGEETTVEEARELLGDAVRSFLGLDGSMQRWLNCVDDGTSNEFSYRLVFGERVLRRVSYDGRGDHVSMPSCLTECAD